MKTTFFVWMLAGTLAAGGLGGCRKSPAGTSSLTWTPGSDIYFVGDDSGHAVYWKNGVKTVLGPGEASGIAFSGSDIYVGGIAYKSGTDLAALWKDGVEQDLTDKGYTVAAVPVVVGTDVYIAGYIGLALPQSDAVYWKNGQVVYVDTTARSWAWDVAINGSDVYVLGAIHGSYDTSVIWKNGQRLPGASTGTGETYSQMMFSGGNMYVVGGQGYFCQFSESVQAASGRTFYELYPFERVGHLGVGHVGG